MIDKEQGNKIQKQTKRTKKLNKKEKKIKTEINRKKKTYLCELGHDSISGVKGNLRQQHNRLQTLWS
jgi:peptide methionine sulfoxide reductase MsrA